MRARLAPALLCSLLLGFLAPAAALTPESWTPHFAVLWIHNGVPTTDSAPSPVLSALGADLTLRFSKRSDWTLDPGIDLYWLNYGMLETQPTSGPSLDLPRAIPLEIENVGSFTVGLVLDAPFTYRVAFDERFAMGFGIGPALLFRLGFGGPDPGAVNAWFYGAGRFLLAETRVSLDFVLQEGFSFVLGLQGQYPLANLWTDADAAMLFDHASLRVSLGVRIAVNAAAPVPSVRPEDTEIAPATPALPAP